MTASIFIGNVLPPIVRKYGYEVSFIMILVGAILYVAVRIYHNKVLRKTESKKQKKTLNKRCEKSKSARAKSGIFSGDTFKKKE